MAIAVRDTPIYTYANTTSVTMNAPTGFTTGDVLVCMTVDYRSYGGATTAPTGWTQQAYSVNQNGRVQIFTAAYGKNSLTGTSWSFTGFDTRCMGGIIAFSGCDDTSIFNGTPTARTNLSGTTGTTAVTTTAANSLILGGFITAKNVYTWSAEQVATGPLSLVEQGTETAGGTYFDMVWASAVKSATGTTGASSGTMSTNYANGAVLIALTPAAATAPTVTTSAASDLNGTSATGNGNVTADGGATITERGVCWGASANPTTADSKATASGTTGAFTASMTGLTLSTHYHYRAYATNSVGTSYGADTEFDTAASITLYCRSDTATVNGLAAYKLLDTNTTSGTSIYNEDGSGSSVAYYNSNVVIRTSGGSESVIGAWGTGQTSRTTDGVGTQSATWSCPGATIGATDSLVVRLGIGTSSSGHTTSREFSTAQNPGSLSAATWTFFYYSEMTNWSDGEGGGGTSTFIYHGSAANPTRIEGITFGAGGGGAATWFMHSPGAGIGTGISTGIC